MEEVIEARPRLEMVRLATTTNPSFSVSNIELERPGRSYTIDTLRYFRERHQDSLFFILGREAFEEIETWKDFQDLFSVSNFIVMTHSGFGKTPSPPQLPESLASAFRYDQEGRCWIHISGHTLYFREISFLDISSTKVREMIERGGSVKYLIPPEVEAFIQSHGLYRKNRKPDREAPLG